MEAYDNIQVRLAEADHYNRALFDQLLGGKKPITEKARMLLSLALRSLTGRNNLDVCTDYLGATFNDFEFDSRSSR